MLLPSQFHLWPPSLFFAYVPLHQKKNYFANNLSIWSINKLELIFSLICAPIFQQGPESHSATNTNCFTDFYRPFTNSMQNNELLFSDFLSPILPTPQNSFTFFCQMKRKKTLWLQIALLVIILVASVISTLFVVAMKKLQNFLHLFFQLLFVSTHNILFSTIAAYYIYTGVHYTFFFTRSY